MALPQSLLDAAAQHRCFPGVFSGGNRSQLFSGTSHPVELVDFACQSCFHFWPACAAADLGSGTTHEQAAVLITEHVRAQRGYHTVGSVTPCPPSSSPEQATNASSA